MTFSRASGSSSSPSARLRGDHGVVVDLHHPAAGVLPFGLQEDRAGLLQHVERARPELEAEDVAFPRQQLVVDVEARHRLQVGADHGVGDERGEARGRLDAVLDVVQRRGADRQTFLVAVVPLGDARVEIPAVVVEPRRSRRSASRRRDRCSRAAETRRRRPRPARRCRRCSSGPRPDCRGTSATRTSVSPSAELRRWPMCAALFGLIAVCSTMVFSGCARRRRAALPARPSRASRNAGRSRKTLR